MNKGMLKMMGIDVHKETTETLIDSGEKFSQELNCPIEEVCIRIRYAKDGKPYYELFHIDTANKRSIKVRDAKLEEVI